MADDDEAGGTPACFLDEVDPAYAGYLSDAETGQLLALLLAGERAARAMARALGAPALADEFGRIETALTGEIRPAAPVQPAEAPSRFAIPADSLASWPALAALESELIAALETALPRVRSDALHEALNRALTAHRALQQRDRPA